VTAIGEYAFYDCSSLKSVDLEKVTEIGNQTFYYCKALESVGSLKNVTAIGGHAFYGCSSLKSVDLEKVTAIEGHAFYNCPVLEIHYEGTEADWNTKVTVASYWKGVKTPLIFNK
jgi:hypothetical protein